MKLRCTCKANFVKIHKAVFEILRAKDFLLEMYKKLYQMNNLKCLQAYGANTSTFNTVRRKLVELVVLKDMACGKVSLFSKYSLHNCAFNAHMLSQSNECMPRNADTLRTVQCNINACSAIRGRADSVNTSICGF